MGTEHGLAWVEDKSRIYKCDDAKPSELLVLVIFDMAIIEMEGKSDLYIGNAFKNKTFHGMFVIT